MSSNTTSTSKEQHQNQVDVSTHTEQQQSLQNIPNRRPMKNAPKAPVSGKSSSAFRTISEVATELGVQQHVLRFWESKFSHVQPLKRGGGRRYYSPKDVDLLKNIQHLLYNEGYTIKGVQKLLQKTRGNLTSLLEDKKHAPEAVAVQKPATLAEAVDNNRDELQSMLAELKSMRELID